MNTGVVAEQCHCDRDEHDDEHHALLVTWKAQESEQAGFI